MKTCSLTREFKIYHKKSWYKRYSESAYFIDELLHQCSILFSRHDCVLNQNVPTLTVPLHVGQGKIEKYSYTI